VDPGYAAPGRWSQPPNGTNGGRRRCGAADAEAYRAIGEAYRAIGMELERLGTVPALGCVVSCWLHPLLGAPIYRKTPT